MSGSKSVLPVFVQYEMVLSFPQCYAGFLLTDENFLFTFAFQSLEQANAKMQTCVKFKDSGTFKVLRLGRG